LETVANILKTEAILISNPFSEHKDTIKLITRRVEGFIAATKYVMISYNIHNDLLNEAVKITPGKKSPNVANLAEKNHKAVTGLVLKKDVPLKMDELSDLGATDILTFELSNTRM